MQTPLSLDTVVVDRYCILKILHQGAAGWVYLTIDQTTKGFCVLEEVCADSNAIAFLQAQFNELFAVLKLREVAHYQGTIVEFDRLYLVRDYAEGHSYRELFEQSRISSEKEVMRFLRQVLLILRSLHRREIVHQNLSFNSIVQRLDGSLMLAEFTQASFVEQEFDADLFAVAVMSIVFLTGCEPKELYDEMTQTWKWRDRTTVQPRLAQVLDRMLSPHLQHRYPSAAKVLQALFAPHRPDFASIVFTFVLIGLAAISAYRMINHLSNLQPVLEASPIAIDAASTPQEKPKETIQQRSKRLGLNSDLLNQIINDSTGTQTAEKLINQLEPFSQEARSAMGTYKRADYNTWLTKTEISDRAIELLTDAQFVSRFPDQKGKVLNPRTFGQIWYAIARDQITKIQLETLPARGTLRNGVGKVYRSQFKQGQTLKLNLKSDSITVWIFSADTTLLKSLDQSSWTGKVSRSGSYEIVIVPSTTSAAQYELSIETSSTSK
ncbi:MAG: hypothetical protein KME10_01740 [Plectolyngbya sp. WJT66-NPBG17]|jgi:serine/threonine-protein kinase|nr:hypothetical protein [Plectolyngbya sp. WJT66-NPBG17]